jgi:F-type H+-transporting ATPase subunit c
VTALAVAIAIALPAFGAALAQGQIVSATIDAAWRQPEALGDARGVMILGLAFTEALAIYGLLIAFLLYGKV